MRWKDMPAQALAQIVKRLSLRLCDVLQIRHKTRCMRLWPMPRDRSLPDSRRS